MVPTTNPSGGSLLYTDSTELYLRTPSGTVFNLTDEITGPGSATDEALVIFSGTTGKVVQNSLVTGTDAGRLNAGDGSVTTPAYSFTSDVDTGLYISGTDVYLTTGGGVGCWSVVGGWGHRVICGPISGSIRNRIYPIHDIYRGYEHWVVPWVH